MTGWQANLVGPDSRSSGHQEVPDVFGEVHVFTLEESYLRRGVLFIPLNWRLPDKVETT
jgi:hypothetical protein